MPSTDDEVYKAFRLVYLLHPDKDTAVVITMKALDYFHSTVLPTKQHKRWWQRTKRQQVDHKVASKPSWYKRLLSSAELLQMSVYTQSERWELYQELQRGWLRDTDKICEKIGDISYNGYQPTREDRLVRYVKCLATRTMDRPSVFTALSVGCLLYNYSSSQIAYLAPDVFRADNLRRVYKYLLDEIAKRFPDLPVESQSPNGMKKIRTSCTRPTKQERNVLLHASEWLTPWDTPHLSGPRTQRWETLQNLFLNAYDDNTLDEQLEAQRAHALIHHTNCAGFTRLVQAYNAGKPPGKRSQGDKAVTVG